MHADNAVAYNPGVELFLENTTKPPNNHVEAVTYRNIMEKLLN